MIAVRDHLSELGDAAVAVVTFASADRLADYRRHLGLSFPILADPALITYRLFGAGRGRWRHVYSPGTLRRYRRLVRAGAKLERPTEDVRQLGADVVIDRAGQLAYLALPPTPDDRPPVAELVAAVRACR